MANPLDYLLLLQTTLQNTMKPLFLSIIPSLLLPTAYPLTISQINGDHYLSSYADKHVSGLEGLVTATSSSGFYLRSTSPDSDPQISDSVLVYTNSSDVSVGDILSLNGKVSEYRSSEKYVYMTEITSPNNITVASTGNEVTPVTLGKGGRSPPTGQFSGLDEGDFLGPGNSSLISESNPELDPEKYGMDFWQSLSAELVTISRPRAVGKPNQYGDTWIVGDWNLGGAENERGGLTMRSKGLLLPLSWAVLMVK